MERETDLKNSNPLASSHNWTPTQRSNVATLCTHIVYERVWSNKDVDLEWKQQFLANVFQHLAVDDTKEYKHCTILSSNEEGPFPNIFIDQCLVNCCPIIFSPFESEILEMQLLYDQHDNNDNKINIDLLITTFEQPDIRQEIIYEILLVCLGLTRSEISNSSEGLNLKEKVNNLVSNRNNVDTQLTDSIVLVDKLVEYDARSRAVLFKHAQYLNVPITDVKLLERDLAQKLYFLQEQPIETGKISDDGDQNIQGFNDSASTSLISRDKKKKKWHWLATGVGVVVGATAIGLTGGLAAPFVAAGIGAITGAGIIATAASSVTLMTSLFGIAGGGLAGYKMHKRLQGLKEFSFTRIVHDNSIPLIPSLHVNIVISGYLLEDVNEVTTPWLPTFENVSDYSDTFALSFDTEILLSLGRSFRRFLAESAVKIAASEAIKRTVFATLASALMLPAALMKAGDLIDNPWALGVDRAHKAGLVLADVLTERVQGKRPTVLIGYSLGALVIWKCLRELVKRQQYGLIDSVVLIGAPISSTPVSKWEEISSVISRRFINVYATNDIVLALIYRMHSLDLNIAGLSPVNCSAVENFDITEYTTGHLGYREPEVLTNILKKIHLD
ncbi:7673_t:CDS:2 [Cetraspora pellucida]|uniref:7673_t:CDS:1 n=1 Tax=Cetraspora pellucida TaxID=1433469 RepID=A0A9N9GK92_9GLOM|nr:7673_t:CDS:2 [Cetraspora pellucida]